jgi:hypothetical protein
MKADLSDCLVGIHPVYLQITWDDIQLNPDDPDGLAAGVREPLLAIGPDYGRHPLVVIFVVVFYCALIKACITTAGHVSREQLTAIQVHNTVRSFLT